MKSTWPTAAATAVTTTVKTIAKALVPAPPRRRPGPTLRELERQRRREDEAAWEAEINAGTEPPAWLATRRWRPGTRHRWLDPS